MRRFFTLPPKNKSLTDDTELFINFFWISQEFGSIFISHLHELMGNAMQKIKWLILSLLCFTFSNELNASNVITDIPTGGIVISSPGIYVFGNNITWSPSGDGQAILIESNDVILDLKNYTLESEITPFNTTGIVATSVENLIIKNGTIANMALGGIQCEKCVNILIKNITIDGLNIENTATYTVPVGILVNTSTAAVIKKCTVKNIDVMTGSTAAIQLTETIYSTVSKCLITNLINRDGACTGIGHLLCDTAEVKSCTLDNIQSEFINNLNTEGHTAIGIIPVGTTNLQIENCTISNITGCCDDAHGMSLFECLNAVVMQCKVENVLDGAGAAQTGAKATGIEVYASGVTVYKCSVKNITAINPQDKQATGFSCAQCVGVKFIECQAENVNVFDENGEQNSSLGYGTGFGWAPDPRPEFIVPAVDILYKECTAKRCQVGFDSWFHIASVWKDIYSNCNGISVLDLNNSQRTISCNACSECGCLQTGCYPTPLTVTIDNVATSNIFLNVRAKYCQN